MTDNFYYEASLDQETHGLVLVETVGIKPVEQDIPGVSNPERIDWL
jgi:hypothetical protein